MEVEEAQVSILKDIHNTTNKEDKSKNKVKFVAQEKKKEEEQILPLENGWCFWEDHYINHGERATQEEYLASLKQLSSFTSVQGFWTEFNKLPNLSKVPNNSCYHLMKKDVRPIWEDPENENGGVLILKVKKLYTDEIWNELVLSVIGEQFSSYLNGDDDICGVSIRKKSGLDFNMIHVWNKNSSGQSAIGRALKHLVPFLADGSMNQYYRVHKQDQVKINNSNGNKQLKEELNVQEKKDTKEALELEKKIEQLKKEIEKEETNLESMKKLDKQPPVKKPSSILEANKKPLFNGTTSKLNYNAKEFKKEPYTLPAKITNIYSPFKPKEDTKMKNTEPMHHDSVEDLIAQELRREDREEMNNEREFGRKLEEGIFNQDHEEMEKAEEKEINKEEAADEKEKLFSSSGLGKRGSQEEIEDGIKEELEEEAEQEWEAEKDQKDFSLEKQIEDAIESEIERKQSIDRLNDDFRGSKPSFKHKAEELKKKENEPILEEKKKEPLLFDSSKNNNNSYKSNITQGKVYDEPTLEYDD